MACNVIAICAITGTYVWREMVKNMFVWKSNQRRVHQSDVENPAKKQNQVKNTDGVQLAFNNETDLYFKQLDLQWS
jgi:hypothetical protein